MKPVLLATDGSPTAEKATATAIDLARRLDTELVIVSVWDIAYAGYSAMGYAPIPMNGELAKLGEEEATKVIAEAAFLKRVAAGQNVPPTIAPVMATAAPTQAAPQHEPAAASSATPATEASAWRLN